MKQNKFCVAVTGGIGSGKSTVMRVIGEMGYPVFSADAIGREIYEDASVLRMVCERFPNCVQNGKVDRKALADEVFSNRSALKELNSFTHPAIMKRLWGQVADAQGKIVFVEVPLLFEDGYAEDFDRVLIVWRDKEERVCAVMERDGLRREDVLARMENQFDYEKILSNGHTVIKNDGDRMSLRAAVERVVHAIEAEAKQ